MSIKTELYAVADYGTEGVAEIHKITIEDDFKNESATYLLHDAIGVVPKTDEFGILTTAEALEQKAEWERLEAEDEEKKEREKQELIKQELIKIMVGPDPSPEELPNFYERWEAQYVKGPGMMGGR